MARRRFQRGSLYQRGDMWYGRWREDVVDAITTKRKRVHRKQVIGTIKEFPTKRLAQRALEEKLSWINAIAYRPNQLITFSEFADRWMKTILIHHKPSSQSSERAHILKWLCPKIGNYQMSDLNSEILQMFVGQLAVRPKTVRNIWATTRAMLRSAKTWGYVREKIWEDIKLPRLTRPTLRLLTAAQSKEIIDAAEGQFKLMYKVLAETGMRGGELCGLMVKDFNKQTGQLAIERSAWRGQLQTPKNMNAFRTITISPTLRLELEKHIAGKEAETILFPTSNGTAYDNANIVSCHFKPLLVTLGIPLCGLHAFRHLNASEMDRLNIPLEVRKSRLGHSDIMMTLNTYTHSTVEDHNRVAAQMGGILGHSVPSESQSTEA